MAMFPTHIKTSTILGIGYGAGAFFLYDVPAPTSIVGAGLCSVAGMLPDIDSGPGIPLREITMFLAAVIPTMLISRMLSHGLSQEMIILVGAVLYVGIRYGLATFLRHYTVHRGMFHSFPALAIFAEMTYLLFFGQSTFVRLFMAGGVTLGFLSHLLLDEIYSVEWDGRPRLKPSFGSAMKFIGTGWWPNFTCYAKLAVLTFLVMNDPSVVQRITVGQGDLIAKDAGNPLDRLTLPKFVLGSKGSSASAPAASIPQRPATTATTTVSQPNTSAYPTAPLQPPAVQTPRETPRARVPTSNTVNPYTVPANPASDSRTTTKSPSQLPVAPATRNTPDAGVPFWQ